MRPRRSTWLGIASGLAIFAVLATCSSRSGFGHPPPTKSESRKPLPQLRASFRTDLQERIHEMSPELCVGLLALSVVLLVLACLMDIFYSLKLFRFRHGFDGGPEDAKPDGSFPTYTDLYNQLIALGFQPLGVYWEQGRFMPRMTEFAFCSKEHGCIAAVHGLETKGDYGKAADTVVLRSVA